LARFVQALLALQDSDGYLDLWTLKRLLSCHRPPGPGRQSIPHRPGPANLREARPSRPGNRRTR
jgi:hypothetical protein